MRAPCTRRVGAVYVSNLVEPVLPGRLQGTRVCHSLDGSMRLPGVPHHSLALRLHNSVRTLGLAHKDPGGCKCRQDLHCIDFPACTEDRIPHRDRTTGIASLTDARYTVKAGLHWAARTVHKGAALSTLPGTVA